jgi:hypothetical protein
MVSFFLAFLPITYTWLSSPHSCYMLHPLQSPRLYNPHYNWRSVPITQLLVMKFSENAPLHLSSVQIVSSASVLKHLQPLFFPQFQRRSFTPKQNQRKNCSFVAIFLPVVSKSRQPSYLYSLLFFTGRASFCCSSLLLRAPHSKHIFWNEIFRLLLIKNICLVCFLFLAQKGTYIPLYISQNSLKKTPWPLVRERELYRLSDRHL